MAINHLHAGAILAAAAFAVAACSTSEDMWTATELETINGDGVMRVLTITPEELAMPADSLTREDAIVLRGISTDFSPAMLASETYSTLAARMVATVTSPEQDGVGIAGPQVGISRRIVAVQRFDKEGEPFEVYPNIRITSTRGEKEDGGEGCLSVPGWHGIVPRYQDIDICYTGADGETVSERVTGFTAVIFQHECDHLDGVLYPDRASDLDPVDPDA